MTCVRVFKFVRCGRTKQMKCCLQRHIYTTRKIFVKENSKSFLLSPSSPNSKRAALLLEGPNASPFVLLLRVASKIKVWVWSICGMILLVKGKPQWKEKILPYCHFVYNEIHMYWPTIEAGPSAVRRRRTAA
jgi:hypothetical protein